MRLSELAGAEGFGIRAATTYGSLARAMLANLKAGLSHSHVNDAVARDYLNDVLSAIVVAEARMGSAAGQLHVDTVYRVMVKVLEDYEDRFFFHRAPQPQNYLQFKAVSYQSHGGFHFWLKDVPSLGVGEPDPATIMRLCDALKDPVNWETGRTIGHDVLWLTPYDGEVKRQVDQVRQPFGTGTPDVANRLRELLGLVRRHPGEHAIAIITRNPLRGLLEKPNAGPFAPTIFEARGYERFRHWPAPGRSDPNHVGRTYDLNSSARRAAEAGSHGVPEVVTLPLNFDEIEQIIYLGAITEADDLEVDSWVARESEDHEFAEEVSAGEDLVTLVTWLAQRLGL